MNNNESASVSKGMASDRSGVLPLLAILVLAFAVRVYGVGDAPYWHDEVHNLVKSEYLADVLMGRQFVANHPPLFTVLLSAWRAIGLGGSEFTSRLLTVFIGVGGVAAVYVAGRRMFDTKTALLAALLVAIAPFHVLHARDLKDYVLLPLTGTLAIWALYRAAESNKTGHWVLYGVLAALTCYSETFAAPLLTGVNIWFLLQLPNRWNRLPKWFLANLGGALLFTPYLFILLQRFDHIVVQGQANWIPRPGLIEVLAFSKAAAFGYSGLKPWMYIACALFAIAGAAGLWLVARRNFRLALLLVCWSIVPVLGIYVMSHITSSFFLYRGMLAMTIPLYLIAARTIAALPNRTYSTALTASFVVIAAISLRELYLDRFPPREFPHRPAVHTATDFDLATEHILSNWQEGDVVITPSIAAWYPMMWYGLQNKPHYAVTHSAHTEKERYELQMRTSYLPWTEGYYPRAVEKVALDRQRIWFVFDDWEPEYLAGNAIPIWNWLNAHYIEVSHETFTNIEIMEYVPADSTNPPTRITQRDEDTAVTAELTYDGPERRTYTKTRPDDGLVPMPAQKRRGDLTLRFIDREPSGPMEPAIDLRMAPDPFRTVYVEVQNHSGSVRSTRLIAVASDAVISPPSLVTANPGRDAWAVHDMYNPSPPPPNHPLPVRVCFAFNDDRHVLIGDTPPLAAGTYATRTFYMGYPGDTAIENAHSRVTLANQNIFADLPAGDGIGRWNILQSAPVQIAAEGESQPVKITAWRPNGLPKSYANLAWIALRKQDDSQRDKDRFPVLDIELEAAPESRKSWPITIEDNVPRLDVWLLEYGDDGRGYHIYRIFE